LASKRKELPLDIQISEVINKEELIKKETAKLTRIFSKLPAGTKSSITNLINEASFMSVSLSELRAIINKKGYIEEYQNGENQKGIKKAAEVDIYNSLIKHYMAIMKQLLDLLPKAEVTVAENIIAKFGSGREDV
jgi:hypothetical protein